MSKNTLYLVSTILALVIIALIMSPKKAAEAPAANPANGLVTSKSDTGKEAVPAPVPAAPAKQ